MIIFHIHEPEQKLKETVGIKMKDKSERSESVK
jgi:hypothetical protein